MSAHAANSPSPLGPGGTAGGPEAIGLDRALLGRLRARRLANRRPLRGPGAGRRRSPSRGSSVELMDFRNYAPGDDFRRLDWNAYARLERLYLRLYRAEENLAVRVLLDGSESMRFGQPSKFDFARRLAGALAYVALVGYDRLSVACFGGGAPSALPATSGEAAAWRVWDYLARLQPGGSADFARALGEAAHRSRGPGLSIVLTDALQPERVPDGLRALLAAGHEVLLVQVLARDELEPEPSGDWGLVDCEDPARQVEVTLTPAVVAGYRRRLDAYVHELRAFCHGRGVGFVQLSSDAALEDALALLLGG